MSYFAGDPVPSVTSVNARVALVVVAVERRRSLTVPGVVTAPTLIDTFCEVVPPLPVQERVKVVLEVGEIDCVPLVPCVPLHPFDAVHEVALVVDQVSVAD